MAKGLFGRRVTGHAPALFLPDPRELDPFPRHAAFLTVPHRDGGPGEGRFVVCGKSPLTGLRPEIQLWGVLGPELRFAGYDGFVDYRTRRFARLSLAKRGRAEVPGTGTFMGAGYLYECRTSPGRVGASRGQRVAGDHLAGEKGGPVCTGIMCDHGRLAGRTGLGAIMGAKNLKAIAVHGGSNRSRRSDLARYATASLRAPTRLEAARMNPSVVRELGDSRCCRLFGLHWLRCPPRGIFPLGTFENVDKVSGATHGRRQSSLGRAPVRGA